MASAWRQHSSEQHPLAHGVNTLQLQQSLELGAESSTGAAVQSVPLVCLKLNAVKAAGWFSSLQGGIYVLIDTILFSSLQGGIYVLIDTILK